MGPGVTGFYLKGEGYTCTFTCEGYLLGDRDHCLGCRDGGIPTSESDYCILQLCIPTKEKILNKKNPRRKFPGLTWGENLY
jgi:hypothetical protein